MESVPAIAGYRPGALAGVVGLHAAYYAREWGFGLAFETKVAGELAAFLRRLDPDRDLFLTAHEGDRLLASVSLDGSEGGPDGAHLRWFIVADGARGTGLGRTIFAEAMRFCDERHAGRCWLTTFAGLDAARSLYERHGFALARESAEDQWAGGVREQLFLRQGIQARRA